MFKPAMRALKKIKPDAEDIRDRGADEATEAAMATKPDAEDIRDGGADEAAEAQPHTPKARKIATFTRALARK